MNYIKPLKVVAMTLIASYLPVTIAVEDNGLCNVKQTSVYFGNGVWNSPLDAKRAKDEIKIGY